MRGWWLFLGLAACSPIERAEPIPHRFDDGGIQVLSSPLRIDFGRTKESTIPAASKLFAETRFEQVAVNCGGQPGLAVTWSNGVKLLFVRSTFLGWEAAGERSGVICV